MSVIYTAKMLKIRNYCIKEATEKISVASKYLTID